MMALHTTPHYMIAFLRGTLRRGAHFVAAGGTLVVLFCAAAVASAAAQPSDRAGAPPHISIFVRDDCVHCRDQKAFLTEYLRTHPDVRVRYHNVDVPAERERFVAIAQKFGLAQGTPITLVGTTIFAGFDTAETTGALMVRLLENAEAYTTFEDILAGTAPDITVQSSLAATCDADPRTGGCSAGDITVRTPWGSTINLATFSLAGVALTLGFIDGFNPCAMWVLIVFLTLLLQTGSRRRMWQYAGLFILAEAVMYYVILMVWFSTWNFVALSRITTPLVGMLALGGGLYFLYKFFTWRNVCTVRSSQSDVRLQSRIARLAQKPLTLATAGGVIAIAFSVNVFEFACSVGIPQAFTKILEMNAVSTAAMHGYTLLYILMYMVDDLIVFALALYGASHVRNVMGYSRWTTLAGGILMVALGLLMLLKPSALIF